MPYRRLPNTDAARIKALSSALNQSMQVPPNELAFTYKTLQKVKYFLPTYKQSLAFQKMGYSNTTERGSTFSAAQKKFRLYVSHFIQVLNFCIAREEYPKTIREFYGLEKFGKKLPPLQTEDELLEWGNKIIEGEDNRIKGGGTPIMNPRIALVKISFNKYIEAQRNHKIHFQKNTRAVEYVTELRQEANDIILEVWNEVEAKYNDLPPVEKRAQAQKYGLAYVFRKSELENNKEQ